MAASSTLVRWSGIAKRQEILPGSRSCEAPVPVWACPSTFLSEGGVVPAPGPFSFHACPWLKGTGLVNTPQEGGRKPPKLPRHWLGVRIGPGISAAAPPIHTPSKFRLRGRAQSHCPIPPRLISFTPPPPRQLDSSLFLLRDLCDANSSSAFRLGCDFFRFSSSFSQTLRDIPTQCPRQPPPSPPRAP